MDTASLQAPETFLAVQRARLAALRACIATIFPVHRPVVLEIGCGHGHYLTAFAAAHPGLFCIGLDRNIARVRRAEKKRAAAGLENLRFIRCDVHDFLQCVDPGLRFVAVITLFPDPWPKKRHHKNRLIQSPFLDTLVDKMASGGRLYFRTDHLPYFEFAIENLTAHPRWALVLNEPWIFESQTVFQEKAPIHHSLTAALKETSAKRTKAGIRAAGGADSG